MSRITLGMKVKDEVTGFAGVVTGYHSWLTGCDTVTVQPPVDKDGKQLDSQGFDVVRLTVIEAHPLTLPGGPSPAPALRDTGGPQSNPKQPNRLA